MSSIMRDKLRNRTIREVKDRIPNENTLMATKQLPKKLMGATNKKTIISLSIPILERPNFQILKGNI